MCRQRGITTVMLLALFLPALVAAGETSQRDPLRPPNAVRETDKPTFNADAWQLYSTLIADGRRVAIVNGQDVRVGDRVGGASVIAIDAGRVQLDYRGRRFTIRKPDVGISKR